MTLEFMWHEVNYQVIIKTRSIYMFRYMSHTIYLRTQVERGWLLKTDGDRRTYLEWVPCMPGTTVQEYSVLSRNVPLGTRSYYMPVGFSIRPNRNRVSPLPKRKDPGDYGTPDRRQGSRGASRPHENAWWPPGRIQVYCRATL